MHTRSARTYCKWQLPREGQRNGSLRCGCGGKPTSMMIYDGESLLLQLLAWPQTSSSCMSASCFSYSIMWRSQLLPYWTLTTAQKRNCEKYWILRMKLRAASILEAVIMTICFLSEWQETVAKDALNFVSHSNREKRSLNIITDPVRVTESTVSYSKRKLNIKVLTRFCQVRFILNTKPTKKKKSCLLCVFGLHFYLASWIKRASAQLANCSKSSNDGSQGK